MSEVDFKISHLSWHVFHVKVKYVRDASQTLRRRGQQKRGYYLYPEGFETFMKNSITGRWSVGQSSNMVSCPIYIEDSKDAVMFKLTWADDAPKPTFRT